MTSQKVEEKHDDRDADYIIDFIERVGIPPGFTLEVRKRLFDGSGKHLLELELVISGLVGTSTVRCYIECRDRAYAGPAGSEWIQSLIRRREVLRLDKMMAVSSTGFTESATSMAADAGIELRLLQTLGPADFANWLPPPFVPLIQRDHSSSVPTSGPSS